MELNSGGFGFYNQFPTFTTANTGANISIVPYTAGQVPVQVSYGYPRPQTEVERLRARVREICELVAA